MLRIISFKYSSRFRDFQRRRRAASRRTARINIQIDQPRSHNSSLLWWEHCRKAQVAIQLFNEYDNYFSHMPRLCKNTCSEPRHQADDGPEPTACLPSTRHHYWHSLYSSFAPLSPTVCSCFCEKNSKKKTIHLGHSSENLGSRFLCHPPTPTLIPFAWLWWSWVGGSVTMETGAEAVEGSQWVKRGGWGDGDGKDRKRLWTGRCRGIHERSSDASLTQTEAANSFFFVFFFNSPFSGGNLQLWFYWKAPRWKQRASPSPPAFRPSTLVGKAVTNAPDVLR